MTGFAPPREETIRSIRELADTNGGVPLGRMAFEKATGISESQWLGRYWTKWSDAVAEAGLTPNALQHRHDTNAILQRIVTLARGLGHVPTIAELKIARRSDRTVPSHNTVATHFGGQSGLVEAIRAFCDGNEHLNDVLRFLPTAQVYDENEPQNARPNEHGWVYLIRSGAHCKIGRSDQLERRIKEIKIALPEAATLVHAIETDDPAGIEAYWHRRFAHKRANGEWFSLDRDDLAAFRRRRFQ